MCHIFLKHVDEKEISKKIKENIRGLLAHERVFDDFRNLFLLFSMKILLFRLLILRCKNRLI